MTQFSTEPPSVVGIRSERTAMERRRTRTAVGTSWPFTGWLGRSLMSPRSQLLLWALPVSGDVGAADLLGDLPDVAVGIGETRGAHLPGPVHRAVQQRHATPGELGADRVRVVDEYRELEAGAALARGTTTSWLPPRPSASLTARARRPLWSHDGGTGSVLGKAPDEQLDGIANGAVPSGPVSPRDRGQPVGRRCQRAARRLEHVLAPARGY